MPYYNFKEIWTPLKMVGIKLYKDDLGDTWIKFWKAKRKRLGA